MVGEQVSDAEAASLFRKCSLEGRAHGAKVVLSIDDESKDNQADITSEIVKSMAKDEGGIQLFRTLDLCWETRENILEYLIKLSRP